MTDCVMTEVRFNSCPDYLPRLRRILGCIAKSIGLSEQEEHDTKLALTEAVANAIRHGSPNGSDCKVSLRLYKDAHSVVAEVTDEGKGFDPGAIPPREQYQAGGMGIPLMQTLTDGVEFEKNGRGMTVRFRKEARGR